MRSLRNLYDSQSKFVQIMTMIAVICTILSLPIAIIVPLVIESSSDDPPHRDPPPPETTGAPLTSSSIPTFTEINCKLGSVNGSTRGAEFFAEEPCGDARVPKEVPAVGSWFALVGDGSTVTLSTCSAADSPFDSRIRVYHGSMFENRNCLTGNDDDGNCTHSKSLSSVNFATMPGTSYFVLVDGREEADFVLDIDCTPPASMPPITTPPASMPPITANGNTGGAGDTHVTVTEQIKLIGSDGYDKSGTMFDYGMGYHLALDGDTLVVGNKYDGGGGKAFVFKRQNGTFKQQVVLGPTTPRTDEYGSSVAISGETIVVCSPGEEDATAGSCDVFVLQGSSWFKQQTLTGLDTSYGDNFGWGVALSGNTLVVGAPNDGVGGKLYIFVRSGTFWEEKSQLVASDTASNDFLGRRVAISSSGDTVLAGAQFDGWKSGSAYVFTRTGAGWADWKEQKLKANDASSDSWFGFDVALSGDTAIVAAQWDDKGGQNSGSVYVFVKSSSGVWSQQAKLKAKDTETGDDFGYSVALYGNTLVVGAESADNFSGSAYVFRGAGASWTELKKIKASDYTTKHYFGFSTALSGNTLAVGAIGADAVYVFDVI